MPRRPLPALACLALALSGLVACGGDDESSSPPETLEYVALGDSFTAGPMIPPAYDAAGCLRSRSNYPSLVAAAREEVELTDVSCSGSGTMHLAGPQTIGTSTIPPQLDALTAGTDLVTVSIGGNDNGVLGALLGGCESLAVADPDGAPCVEAEAAGGDPMGARLARLNSNLAAGLAAVQERAPEARVVVIGYPQVVPATGTCPALPLAAGDRTWAYRLNQDLALTVQDVASKAGLEYVDTWTASAGHDICADEPWFNGMTTDEGAALAYHPFAAYEEAVADRLLELL